MKQEHKFSEPFTIDTIAQQALTETMREGLRPNASRLLHEAESGRFPWSRASSAFMTKPYRSEGFANIQELFDLLGLPEDHSALPSSRAALSYSQVFDRAATQVTHDPVAKQHIPLPFVLRLMEDSLAATMSPALGPTAQAQVALAPPLTQLQKNFEWADQLFEATKRKHPGFSYRNIYAFINLRDLRNPARELSVPFLDTTFHH